MKKVIFSLFICLLMFSVVLAQQGWDADNNLVEANVQLKTQNQENDSLLQQQVNLQVGNYLTSEGKQLQIREESNNLMQISSGNVSAKMSMNMTQEGEKLNVQLSNGQNSEIKVMPNVASEIAIERLRLNVCSEENNCTIELKEVGNGNQTKAAYEVKLEKQSKILGLFKAKMQVQAQVDAENGEIIQTRKSWWAFLAVETEE